MPFLPNLRLLSKRKILSNRQDGLFGIDWEGKMRKILLFLWLATFLASVMAGSDRPSSSVINARKAVPDSRQLEKDLQLLNWKQFRTVIEAIPPIKAEVDRYGSLGWQYVQQHYKTYPWRKSIDNLESWQKVELARLIEGAKKPG